MLTENLVHDQEASPENFAELIDLLNDGFRVEHERTSLEFVELKDDGTLITPGGHYQVTQDFLEHAAKAIGMPLGYAYKLLPELFCDNFSKRKLETTCPVTVCHVGDVATGLTLDNKTRYRPAASGDVLRQLQNSRALNSFELRRASVSYRGVDIELVQKDKIIEPDVGDVIEVGIAVSNSENGGRKLMAQAYTYRLICTNGCRMGAKLGTARWPSDIRLTEKASMIAFEKELDLLTEQLDSVQEIYSHIDNRVPDTEVYSLWRRVAYGVSRTEADEIVGLTAEQRQTLQETIRNRSYKAPAQLTNTSAFELHNRVTHAAHGRAFLDRRKLQEIGGNFLQRSIAWSQLTNPSTN